MNIDKIARAILEASRMDLDWDLLVEHWGPDCYKIEELRSMARAAVEALGLEEEIAFEYTHLGSGRSSILIDNADVKVARKIAGETHVLSEVSRLVSPWVQVNQ